MSFGMSQAQHQEDLMILSGQLAALLFARFSWINDPYIHTNREKCKKKNGLLMLDLCHQKQHEDIYLTFYNNYYFLSTITDSFIHSSSVTASQSLFWEHWEYILDGSPVHCSTPLIHTQREFTTYWHVFGRQGETREPSGNSQKQKKPTQPT